METLRVLNQSFKDLSLTTTPVFLPYSNSKFAASSKLDTTVYPNGRISM